jgi:adenylate cyclase
MTTSLGNIRAALEGAVPAIMATCDAQGVPNVAFLSQVHYVDEQHVALSYQFFSKTRSNILANPQGQLTVLHPFTGQFFRMRLRYLRTESEGALFERMKAHLEGIASHTGMAGVFKLLGSDIYELSALEALSGNTLAPPEPPCNPLAALRRASEALAACQDLAVLLDAALDALVREFGIQHAMLLMLDEAGARLYTVGSRGYDTSGVGSEIALGDGVIGVCAQARTAIRISWLTQAYRYSRAIRDELVRDGMGRAVQTEIPYPGLAAPHSQLGVPILRGTRLLGVLFVESTQDLRFSYDDEDALVTLAGQMGASIDALRDAPDNAPDGPAAEPVHSSQPGPLLRVRRYCGSDSIFFDDQYVIKGVAGAILWRLLEQHSAAGRTEFSNREIRLDPGIRLPDVVDNLEARLVLLRRRLEEQALGVALHKCGRGRLRLEVGRPLELLEVKPG